MRLTPRALYLTPTKKNLEDKRLYKSNHEPLGGGNSNIFYFHHFSPLFGEDEPILTHIFQTG